jgi:hypothetical protein
MEAVIVLAVTVGMAGIVVTAAAKEAGMAVLKVMLHTSQPALGNMTDGVTMTSMLKTRSTRGSGNAKVEVPSYLTQGKGSTGYVRIGRSARTGLQIPRRTSRGTGNIEMPKKRAVIGTRVAGGAKIGVTVGGHMKGASMTRITPTSPLS